MGGGRRKMEQRDISLLPLSSSTKRRWWWRGLRLFTVKNALKRFLSYVFVLWNSPCQLATSLFRRNIPKHPMTFKNLRTTNLVPLLKNFREKKRKANFFFSPIEGFVLYPLSAVKMGISLPLFVARPSIISSSFPSISIPFFSATEATYLPEPENGG